MFTSGATHILPGAPPVVTTTSISTVTTCALGLGSLGVSHGKSLGLQAEGGPPLGLGHVERTCKSQAGAGPDLLFTLCRAPVTGVTETSNSKIVMVLLETSREAAGPAFGWSPALLQLVSQDWEEQGLCVLGPTLSLV